MCGVAGYICWDQPVDKSNLKTMIQGLIHRGPDSQNYWISNDQHIGLIHTRLSILDLSAGGAQPMHAYDARIVFNGEIYNFIEIKEELKNKGYLFITGSDTEVVLVAYREWGLEMLNKFNGMWAFAIYDHLKNTILLSRDRYGVKPLYYYQKNNTIIFASEVNVIHKLLGFSHPLNPNVLNDILGANFINHGTEETYLQDVKVLPAGYCIEFSPDSLIKNKWYELKSINVPLSYKDCAKELKELIFDSCKIRLRSDVPVATCLSGGVDSGIITSFISKLNHNDSRFNKYSHQSFCASFPNTPLDEASAAAFLAREVGSEFHVLNVTCPSIELLEESLLSCDGPMHSLAFFPIWSLYKFIKNSGITVTLDGQGPDEMLGGYNPLEDALKAAIELKKPGWFFDLFNTYAAQGENKQSSARIFAFKTMLSVVKQQLNHGSKHPQILQDLTNGLYPVHLNVDSFKNKLDKRLYKYFFQSPLPGLLQQYDRCSMAHGVECRMPFMDYRIVEFIFSLPVEYKIGHGYTKRILREAADNILPDSLRLNKTKIGFNAPVVDWFTGPLRSWLLDQASSSSFINSTYFDGKQIKYNFENFVAQSKPSWNEGWRYWPYFHLTWWLNNLSRK